MSVTKVYECEHAGQMKSDFDAYFHYDHRLWFIGPQKPASPSL